MCCKRFWAELLWCVEHACSPLHTLEGKEKEGRSLAGFLRMPTTYISPALFLFPSIPFSAPSFSSHIYAIPTAENSLYQTWESGVPWMWQPCPVWLAGNLWDRGWPHQHLESILYQTAFTVLSAERSEDWLTGPGMGRFENSGDWAWFSVGKWAPRPSCLRGQILYGAWESSAKTHKENIRGYHKTSEHSSDSRHEWVESTHSRVQLPRGGCCVGESTGVLHPLYLVWTYQQAHFVLGEDSSEQEMAKITICGNNKDPQGDLSPHPERMEHTWAAFQSRPPLQLPWGLQAALHLI